MVAQTSAHVKAEILHEFTRKIPEQSYDYSFSPACEKVVRWLKTPAGTIVREGVYHWAPVVRRFLWMKRVWQGETTRDTEPFATPLEAIKRLQKDLNISVNEAAKILKLDGEW
jgi:hypothetical protein